MKEKETGSGLRKTRWSPLFLLPIKRPRKEETRC